MEESIHYDASVLRISPFILLIDFQFEKYHSFLLCGSLQTGFLYNI